MTDFVVEATSGSVDDLHHRVLPQPVAPVIWVHEFRAAAVVLGSSQRDDVVDVAACRRAGVDLTRRRSGGGAVLLVPGEVTWIDVVVPRTGADPAGEVDRLGDVRAGMVWIGTQLAESMAIAWPALAGRLTVHNGALQATPWSPTVCFDGIGPGEVLLDGVKLVGLSQRLTREAARFQACWYSTYEPTALVDLLAPDSRPPVADLRPIATVDALVGQRLPVVLRATLSSSSSSV